MIYLASPYTSPDSAVRAVRYRQAVAATTRLVADGWRVYSPIVFTHPLVDHARRSQEPIEVKKLLKKDSEFWLNFDYGIMRHCDRLLVLMLSGWETSVGVRSEIQYFKKKRRLMATIYLTDTREPGLVQINWKQNIQIPKGE